MLVGGNAVNLYAYRRTTFDIDLLVRESDAQRWRCFFENEGYAVFHATANFIRMSAVTVRKSATAAKYKFPAPSTSLR